MYVAIAESIFAIRDNVDGTWSGSPADAFGLASICTNFDLIMNLVTVRNCLGYTGAATLQLQGAKIDNHERLGRGGDHDKIRSNRSQQC